MQRRHFLAAIAATLLSVYAAQSGAQCPPPVCTGLTGGNNPTSACAPFDPIRFGADPQGSGFRFTGLFSLAGQLNVPVLQGPVRWYVDGVAVGDTDSVNRGGLAGGSNEYYSILQIEDAQSLNIGPTSEIFVEYIAEENETYEGSQSNFGGLQAEFEGSGCFADLLPLNPVPIWQTAIITSNADIEFAQSVEITASWEAPDYDQNVLTGRFILHKNGNVLETSSIADKTGETYHPKVTLSTLGLGEHVFEASYLGIEGALSVVRSDTVTVRHPRRPLVLRLEPKNFVARSGTESIVSICAANRDGNVPRGIAGREVSINIENENDDMAITPLLVPFDADGCAPINSGSLVAGEYSINASLSNDDRFLRTSLGDRIIVVPGLVPNNIVLDLPSVLGTSPTVITPIAPAAVDDPLPGSIFEPIPAGLVLQAEVLAEGLSVWRPTGGLTLLINGYPISSRILTRSPNGLVTFGPIQMPPGDYTATLAYTGDEIFAPVAGDNLAFSVSAAGYPLFTSRPDLEQEFAGVNSNFEVSMSVNVSQAYNGRPVVLTGFLRAVPGTEPDPGIPVGTMVFKDGSEVLGEVGLAGFAGSIRLPEGLSAGPHDLRAEYLE